MLDQITAGVARYSKGLSGGIGGPMRDWSEASRPWDVVHRGACRRLPEPLGPTENAVPDQPCRTL